MTIVLLDRTVTADEAAALGRFVPAREVDGPGGRPFVELVAARLSSPGGR